MNLSEPQASNVTDPASASKQIILASQSPQRKTLLDQIGLIVSCCPVDIDETPLTGELPGDLVLRLARRKAERCFELQQVASQQTQAPIRIIIGADTTIDLDNTSLGKPEGELDALEMLRRLADREHLVHSGICVIDASTGEANSLLVTTTVRFGPISAAQAKRYWDTGEPHGKAGSYGIQGIGAQFVAHLSGSYSNVVGLPLYETLKLVEKVTI